MKILALKLESGEYEVILPHESVGRLITLIGRKEVETIIFGEKSSPNGKILWEKNFTGGEPWDFKLKAKQQMIRE